MKKIILQHPAITHTAVIGVPDPKRKECIKAVCQLRGGETLEVSDFIRFVGERITSFKKPQYVEFIATFPRKEDGSIDREAVKSEYGR